MSLAVRVIPCLDVDAGRVVKGINFQELRDAGDPVELAKVYDAEGADELTFLDISASHEGRATTMEIVSRTAEQVFIPLTVGRRGGQRRRRGPAAARGRRQGRREHRRDPAPELVAEIADRFGNQVLVLSVDARRVATGTRLRLRGDHPRRPRVGRPGRPGLGGAGGRARRRRDPAQRDGRRRHPGRVRPRADPAGAQRGVHPGHRQRRGRRRSSTSPRRSTRARTPCSPRRSSTSARCGSPRSSRPCATPGHPVR